MAMKKPNFELKPELPRVKEKDSTDFLSTERILRLPPKEMTNYLTSIQEQGRLEEFLEKAVEDESLLAQFSYWEKWLEKDQQKLLESIIERKREIYPPKSESLPLELEKKFSEDELELIFLNIKAIQLTYGCSIGCAFCGFDAIKGVREHIPYSQLANMFKKYGSHLSGEKPFLYWASEPSDYISEDKTYKDVHELAVNYADYSPSITSFNLRDQEWIDFMAQTSGNRRLSVFGIKEQQLTQLRLKMAAGRGKYTRGSGEIRFTGRTSRGETIRHVKGVGKSYEQQESTDNIPRSGIACIDGILLTPRGLFNLFVVPISKEYPQGVIIIPLEKITDEPVKEGDNLKEVMRRSVIQGIYSHRGRIFRNEEGKFENFQRYIGKFPKQAIIYGKNKKYLVSVDQGGNIISTNEHDYGPREISYFEE